MVARSFLVCIHLFVFEKAAASLLAHIQRGDNILAKLRGLRSELAQVALLVEAINTVLPIPEIIDPFFSVYFGMKQELA